MDLFRTLEEIEELCVMMTGQEKADWAEDERNLFERIRKR